MAAEILPTTNKDCIGVVGDLSCVGRGRKCEVDSANQAEIETREISQVSIIDVIIVGISIAGVSSEVILFDKHVPDTIAVSMIGIRDSNARVLKIKYETRIIRSTVNCFPVKNFFLSE